MKFSDLNDRQKNELFILNPEWCAYNRPKWMIENHLYYMLNHYPHIIDGLKSCHIVDNRHDRTVDIPPTEADKIFYSAKEIEYEEYDFCKDVKCAALKSLLIGYPSIEVNECNIDICKHTARDFHQWLQSNGFEIRKVPGQYKADHTPYMSELKKDKK